MSFQDSSNKLTSCEFGVEITFKLGGNGITSFPIYQNNHSSDSNEIQFKEKLQSNDSTKWMHDHGELPKLKTTSHKAKLLMSLYEAKEISDNHLTTFINRNSNSSTLSSVPEGSSNISQQNIPVGNTNDVEQVSNEGNAKKIKPNDI